MPAQTVSNERIVCKPQCAWYAAIRMQLLSILHSILRVEYLYFPAGGGGISPSSPMSALFLSAPTTTYSESDSPSLALGVGGKAPGIGGAAYGGCAPCFHPDTGLPPFPGCGRSDVFGREAYLNSEARGLVGFSSFVGLGAKVSPRAVRCRGLDLPDGDFPAGLTPALAAFFKRSSVARRRASRASSSEVWEDTALFLYAHVRTWSKGK